MSLIDRRQKLVPDQSTPQTSGPPSQDVSVEQLPFPDNPTLPVETPKMSPPVPQAPSQAQPKQFSAFGRVTPLPPVATPAPVQPSTAQLSWPAPATSLPGGASFSANVSGNAPSTSPLGTTPLPGNASSIPGAASMPGSSLPGAPSQPGAGGVPTQALIPVSPNATRVLVDLSASANATRQLTKIQTGMLPGIEKNPTTTSLRQPVIIRGSGKKSSGAAPPPKKRRMVVHVAVTALLIFIVLSALIAVIPLGTEGKAGNYNPFSPIVNLINTNSNNTGSIAQQAATATAVTQDGFDPGGGQSYAGVTSAPMVPVAAGSTLNRFFYGQCTYWANMRYHELTGFWVTWLGNAYQWSYGASTSGWIVSAQPKVPSVIVLQPYVQGAGGFGHVAVVEKINSDGSVLTTNYNWAGNWARETTVTFNPGSGVSFIWHP